jgi:hypothetical protein
MLPTHDKTSRLMCHAQKAKQAKPTLRQVDARSHLLLKRALLKVAVRLALTLEEDPVLESLPVYAGKKISRPR